MTREGNADSKWSEKKMEGEDSVRTVDCLRGRLLAERAASRNANNEAEHLGQKLIELENLIKQEAKSRNRAEKKLKSLLKKLESRNISYVSEGSQHSDCVDKSDISSVWSSASSRTKEPHEKDDKIFTVSANLQQNYSELSFLMSQSDGSSANEESFSERSLEPEFQSNDEKPMFLTGFELNEEKITIAEDYLIAVCEKSLEKSSELVLDQNYNDSFKIHDQRVESCVEEEGPHKKDKDQDPEDKTDNSLALVLIDTPRKTKETIDPEVLDETVKEVLGALRRAKEQLQSSMERRRGRMNMIQVG